MAAQMMFMSLATALADNGKSFEEVRIDDYLQAYQSTGRPPAPVPQVPAGDKERVAMGLLPLFKPTLESDYLPPDRPKESLPSSTLPSEPLRRKTNPADIPASQDFKEEKVAAETFFTICCSEPYTWFSPEELRHYAYKRGHKYPPIMEEYQSITTRSEFSQHSFEELRIIYLLAKRELTSPEIIAAMKDR